MPGYMMTDSPPTIDLATDNVTAFTGADQTITLPRPDGYYLISVSGTSCVMRTGGAATLAGRGIFIPESAVIGPVRIASTTVRVISAAAAGYIRFTLCRP
jgi:hypothetical protein